MSRPMPKELRVLRGPQSGCSLPLPGGMYRAGGDECCDVVLEGMPREQSAFVVYVGHKAVALESLTEGVSVGGQPARGLRELRLGQRFEFGPWLFAVDEHDAPWPADPDSLLPSEEAEGARTVAEGALGESSPLGSATAVLEAPEESGVEADANGGPSSGAEEPEAAEKALAPAGAARPRRRLPFWAIGLAGTVAFLGVGVLALTLSLAPAAPAAASGTEATERALSRIASSVGSGGELKVARLPGGRLQLSGYVDTALRRTTLVREARSVDPAVSVSVNADQDLQALAQDTLTRFPGVDVRVAAARWGRLTLEGRVASGKLRDEIVAAMRGSVPGVSAIDDHITADDDALTAVRALLAGTGLAGRIEGHMDGQSRLVVAGILSEADRQAWRDVRAKLAARFGPSLAIVESFQAPAVAPVAARAAPAPARGGATPRSNVVAVVMGPMPYVVLANGEKLAAPHGARAQ